MPRSRAISRTLWLLCALGPAVVMLPYAYAATLGGMMP